jgi:hypothetical protein
MALVPIPASDQSAPSESSSRSARRSASPAAHPPQDVTAGVGEHQQVPAGTGIVGQQVLQRRQYLLRPVLPPQLQHLGRVVQAPRAVLVRADAQRHGPSMLRYPRMLASCFSEASNSVWRDYQL